MVQRHSLKGAAARIDNLNQAPDNHAFDWDLEGDNQFDERAALKILRAVRRRNKKIPIFLIADRTLVSELPLEVVKQVHEYIHLFGDTPAFIANRVDFAVERYHEQLLPPYFRELKKYR